MLPTGLRFELVFQKRKPFNLSTTEQMSDLKAYLLCRFANNSGVYTSWSGDSPIPTVVVDEFLPDWKVPDDAGIIVTHMHYRWEELAALRKVLQQDRVPVLILSDGIIEYRNVWEHPDLAEGSMFQPVLGHKLACIGRGQARVIESWGNAGYCEVVGLPRLDQIDFANIAQPQSTGPFRVLVATATTPAFDQTQRDTVVESLKQLKDWFSKNPVLPDGDGDQGRPIEVVWRLSDGLESDIGLEVAPGKNESAPDQRPPIGKAMESVDAVITTPSTMILESMLRKRPTAVLDFHNSPCYFSTPWTIKTADQIGFTIGELAAPPKHKMMFQEFVLQDQLEFLTPAKPRMLELVEAMVAAGVEARQSGNGIKLPARMLLDPQSGFVAVPDSFELRSLYSNNSGSSNGDQSAFQNREIDQLQIELAAAIKRLEQLPAELVEKNHHIANLNEKLDRARARVDEMHARVVAIRKRFGVKPLDQEE